MRGLHLRATHVAVCGVFLCEPVVNPTHGAGHIGG
jgi:hypothetical protein